MASEAKNTEVASSEVKKEAVEETPTAAGAEKETEDKSVKTENKTEPDTDVKMEPADVEKKSKEETNGNDKTEKDIKAEDNVKKEDTVQAAEEAKPEVKEEKTETNGDKANEPMTDLDKKIIKQIEFYFGDVNLGKDKFLQGQMKQDNGWVKLEVLLTFNRLRSICEDQKVIAAAMKKATSGIIEVNEDDTKIRRNPDKPLPVFNQERKECLKARSLYVKGFPVDITIDSLEEYFTSHGTTEHIQMKRDADKIFKGSIFVLFKTVEEAKKFLEAEGTKYADTELIKMLKDDYFKMKAEEKKKLKENELQDSEAKKAAEEEAEAEAFKKRMTKGTVIHLDGLPDGISFEFLREKFGEFGEVAWVEFKRGDTDARVRFSNEDEGKTALEKALAAGEGKVMLKETEVKARLLEGDDELKFWQDLFNEQKSRKSSAKKRRGGRGGGGSFAKRRRY